MAERLFSTLPLLFALISLFIAVIASLHILIHKRDSRASMAWMGLVWLAPLVGALLYLMLGINRIHSRAQEWRAKARMPAHLRPPLHAFEPEALEPFIDSSLLPLARLASQVSNQPLLGGNHITPLFNGDQAYPPMLEAIHRAEQSITLSTFIMRNDSQGHAFVNALTAAQKRGVQVRLLVDYMGLRYSWPSLAITLRQSGLNHAAFMPPRWPHSLPFLNLRNHRKLLIIDGRYGFTGGMNISAQSCRNDSDLQLRDLHFALEGPVVTELQAIFAEDWYTTTGEVLTDTLWFPSPLTPGSSLSRAIADGPDDRFNTLRQIMLGALTCAQRQIRIQTPYFVPDASLEEALITASLRGVKVQLLLPGNNNLRLVDWACHTHLEHLLRHGVEVGFSPGCFDHSKLFTVDNDWTLLGSANWDNRSLALNFECNVECYDQWLTTQMNTAFDQRFADAKKADLHQLQHLPVWMRLRNASAALLSPYL